LLWWQRSWNQLTRSPPVLSSYPGLWAAIFAQKERVRLLFLLFGPRRIFGALVVFSHGSGGRLITRVCLLARSSIPSTVDEENERPQNEGGLQKQRKRFKRLRRHPKIAHFSNTVNPNSGANERRRVNCSMFIMPSAGTAPIIVVGTGDRQSVTLVGEKKPRNYCR